MNRMALFLALVAAAAVGTLMLLGSAHADPPETGNWTITAFESYYDKTLRVNGSIFIEDGASLFLTDVDLIIDATDNPQLTMAPGGQFIVEGGTIRSIGSPVVMNLEHGGYINGTKIIDIYGINKWDWGGGVTNCAIVNPISDGINMAPKGNKLMPVWFFGNTITGSGGRGINVSILGAPPGHMYLYLYGNTVADSGSDGIWVEVDGAESGSIDLSGNRVERAGGNGVCAWIVMQDLQLDVNDTYISDCLNYGLGISLDVPGHGYDTFDNVTVLNCRTFGVLLDGGSAYWAHLTLSRFDVRDNFIGGMILYSLKDAMLVDSNVINPDVFKGEFSVADTQLDIYRTKHTFASGSINGGSDRITSWLSVNLSYTWQNGAPIGNRSWRLLDDKDKPIESGTTDADGWLGDIPVWNWNLNAMGIQVRFAMTPELSVPPSWTKSGMLSLVGDLDATVVFTDGDPPALDVTAPLEGIYINATSITVNGTCDDTLSGVRLVEVAFGPTTGELSGWHIAGSNDEWEVVLDGLLEGDIRVVVRAYDIANYPNGSFVEVVRTITVDTTIPWMRVVKPSFPAGPHVTNQNQMLFELEFAPDVVTVIVDGDPHVVTLLGRFSETFDLAVGDNLRTWTVVDMAGNTNTTSMVLVLDLTPPTLTVSLPDGLWYTNVSRFRLTGTTDLTNSSVLVNGAEGTITDGKWIRTLDLIEGQNDILIEAVDQAGNWARLSRTVILDTVAPVILIFEPQIDGSVTNKVPITVRGGVDSPLMDGIVTVNGERISVTDGEFSLALPAPADGPIEITVVGSDLAGNEGRATVKVVVDRVAPSVTGLSITDGQLTNDPHLLISGDVEAGAVLHIGSELVDYVGSSFVFELDLAEGANSVSIEALDAVGNRWNGTITVWLDTVPPQLVVDGVLDGRITFQGDGFTLTGRTERGATVLIVVGNVSTPVTVDAMGEFSMEMSLPSKETTIQVRALDPAGNGRDEDIVATRAVLAPAPKWTESPIVRGGSAVAAVLIVLCVAAVLEPSRYALLLLILPLYARIHKHEVLDNKTRYALHGLILENPGLHYNEIIREFGLTNGVAAYHLHVLEREGFLRAVRDGTLKRFYSVTTKVPQDRRLTPDQIRESIVRLVAGRPGINQREIVDELGIGRTVAGYHLKGMVDEGILESSRFGKFTTYKIKPGRRLL